MSPVCSPTRPAAALGRLCLGLVWLALVGMSLPVWAESSSERNDHNCSVRSYSNGNYLYSIAIPEGLRCCIDPPPSPSHGCGLLLPGAAGTYLWVDGSYNSLGFESAENALNFTVGGHLKPGTTLTVLRHEPATLGDFEAVRLTLRITKQGEAKATIEDLVMAVEEREGGRGEVVYTVGLECPEADYPVHEAVFSGIVASWKAEMP